VYDILFYLSKKAAPALLFGVLNVFVAQAQQFKVDSLESVIASKEGMEKYDPLIELIIVYANHDFEKTMQVADRAYEVVLPYGDTAKIIRTQRIKGQMLNRLERPKEAIEILKPYLEMAKRNDLRNEVKTILNNLALAYTLQASYEKALEINFETLTLREQDGDKTEISISLNNIGFVYFKLKNYQTALEFYNRSLAYRQEAPDKSGMDRLLINIGLCHNQIGNYSEAQRYFKEGLDFCGNGCYDQIIIEGEFGYGVSYYFLEDFDQSKKHFRKSLNMAIKTNEKRFEAENYMYLSHIHVRANELDSALLVLERIERRASAYHYNELLISAYREFALVYTKQKEFEKATDYQNRYIALKDSILNGAVIDKLAKIQTNFAERENLKTIANKDEIIERQRSLTFAIIIIALLTTMLVFVLYRGNRVKKRVNQALSDAKAIIEDQNRQLLNSNYNLDRELKEKNNELEKANESLLRVNDELDNFIYKTSHDIRGPLASLKGMCNVAIMDVVDPLALSYLKKLDITAEKLNTILTRLLIVNQINNSAIGLERIDFIGIVNDVLILEKKKGLPPRLKVKKHIDDSIEYYSDKEFIRIILENLIDNAIKFYNDSSRVEPFVDISITEEQKHVKIRVVDNGIGISEVHPDKIFQMFSRASERSETGGIGLYITKTATEKLGGSVHLKTSPEGFTEFYVMLPFSQSRVFA
jgi:signal transduction histidine kinase